MNFLCERIGFFLKQGSSTHDLKLYYFFINDDYEICYCRNYAYIEQIFKESESIQDVIATISKKPLKRINFLNCKVGSIQNFPNLEFIPFPNKNCFELYLNPNSKKLKSVLIFALLDDNMVFLHEFMKNYGTILKKSTLNRPILKETHFKKFSPAKEEENNQELIEFEKKFQLIMTLYEESKNKKNENENQEEEKIEIDENIDKSNEKMQTIILKNGSTYSGQILNGKPHGKGAEFREDKLSYKGDFRNGKWHGIGYIVDSNLDVCEGEFIDGEPVGF